jgi:hypothetical protein
VGGSIYLNIGRYQNIIADFNSIAIYKGAIDVDDYIIAD